MKKMGFKFSLLLVALVLFTASSASAQKTIENAEKATVIKAVAPKIYPAIARSARIGGKVTIKVTVNPKGEVVSAALVNGHALLKAVSLEAAHKWRFAPTERNDQRFVELEFTYTEGDKEEEAGVFFMPPFQVELIAFSPTIYRVVHSHARPRN